MNEMSSAVTMEQKQLKSPGRSQKAVWSIDSSEKTKRNLIAGSLAMIYSAHVKR